MSGDREQGMGKVTDGGEDSVALDVGDSTFAAFLQGNVHVGGGDVALLSALLPHSRPAVAFVLLDNIQHLAQERKRCFQALLEITLKLQDT